MKVWLFKLEIKNFVKVPKSIFSFGSTETYIYSVIGKESLVDGIATVYMPKMLEMLDLFNRTENMKKIKLALTNLTMGLGVKLYTDFRLSKLEIRENIKSSQHYYMKVPEVNSHFVKLFIEDFNNIMSLDIPESKAVLLHQYLFIIGMVDESGKVKKISYPTIDQISDAIGINRKTVMKYNQILLDLELIYYKTVSVKEKSLNIYSRWSDQEDVLEACSEVRKKGRFFKEQKKKDAIAPERISQASIKAPNQKEVINNVDPSIQSALEFFTNAGLAFHKGTIAKLNEAREICGVEGTVIVIKDLKLICSNSMPENQWAGYFSNNIIAKAHHRKAQGEAQRKANAKLDKEPNFSIDYKELLLERKRNQKEMQKDNIGNDLLEKDYYRHISEEEKPTDKNWLAGLGLA
ncbi:hypothetical protein MHH33_06955 [Paenisporosarcina sp. FSL H8-0542]|uniref:hypothetical protein n=1 Tax=Paenisporosarcina sp. FSL H8-0542 TaxID=2921401 RepID=UPI00315AA03A